jgi:hypothetical protein
VFAWIHDDYSQISPFPRGQQPVAGSLLGYIGQLVRYQIVLYLLGRKLSRQGVGFPKLSPLGRR